MPEVVIALLVLVLLGAGHFLLGTAQARRRMGSDPALCFVGALEDGRVEEVATYLDRGWDANTNFWFLCECKPLHFAAHHGHRAVAELLLGRGADPDARDARGGSPLHCAASYGHQDIVELLLARGAVVNAKDDDGETALGLAAASGHTDIVQILEAHGAEG